MHKIRISITLLLFLPLTINYSQKIADGYYNNIENDTYIYVYNDTIILPYYSGMIGISILKGVMGEKWIKFISVEDKMESMYFVVEKKRNEGVSILKFNLYDYFNGKMCSDLYDGRYGVIDGGNAVGYGLGCTLLYTTPQNGLIKKDTVLVFNNKYFEASLSSNLFVNAELTVQGAGKYITVPILKDSLLFVNIVKSPPVYYHDEHKRMKYKYSERGQSIGIRFNFPFNKSWNKYVKTDKPHDSRYQHIIEKHMK